MIAVLFAGAVAPGANAIKLSAPDRDALEHGRLYLEVVGRRRRRDAGRR